MPARGALHENPGMTPLSEAVSSEAVPVFSVDDHGELAELLGTGSRVADDVVLVEGRLADRLAAEAWPSLRVAMPPPDGCDDATIVDVETVHVAEPEKVARFHHLIEADPDSTVVALELVPGPDAAREEGTIVLFSANVICLLFGNLLRICRP
jgi:hypothetical protein